MAERKLAWSECCGAERAQIGALQFFVNETRQGAELYEDSGSFDQGYGSTSHASVEAAKDAAEEIARHTYEELSEHFARGRGWSTTALT